MMDPTERGNIRRYVKMMLFRICEHFFSDADREANWMTARGLSDAFEKEFPFTEITITEGDTKLKLPPKVYVSVGNKHWTWTEYYVIVPGKGKFVKNRLSDCKLFVQEKRWEAADE